MQDRRHNPRRKTFLGARVHYDRQSAEGLVRDMGEHGARITFRDGATPYDEFDVEVPRLNQTLRARVRWRKSHELGVTFTDATVRLRTIERETSAPAPLAHVIAPRPTGSDVDRLQTRIHQVTAGR